MQNARDILKDRVLLFDGGMGTYYRSRAGLECEQANLIDPEGVVAVHQAYLDAGAEAIKTNTFSLPRMAAAGNPDWKAMAVVGWHLACQAAGEKAAVFADLGPAPDTEAGPAAESYKAVADIFLEMGAQNFLFETLSTDAGVAEAAAYIDPDGEMVLRHGDDSLVIDKNDLALKGLHNMFNSMAAGLSASILDIKKDVIRRALEDFEAVEHRLEYVRTVDGVRYVNDSKATNVNSCWYALESMTTHVVLILGGKDKGNDYSEIEKFVKEKVHAIVCLGVDNSKLHKFFDGKVPVVADAGSMEEAVDKCRALAHEGDTVLLSPCCASFDLFKSYEDRGCQFKACVNALADNK